MEATTLPIESIRSPTDLFFCEPYSCKLLARACVERQARCAAGDKNGIRLCDGCEIGATVKANSEREPVAPSFPLAPLASTPTAPPRVAPKPQPSPAPQPITQPKPVVEQTPALCEHGNTVDQACERCSKEPLTRAKLERAMIVYGLYLGQDGDDDAIREEWFDFFHDHGAELIGLSIAALGRIEPRRAGVTYEKHKLGIAQQRIVDLLADQKPRTVSEIAAALGKNYQNTRRMLPVLQARGLIRNEYWPSKSASVWIAAPAPAGKVIHPQRCLITDAVDYCGKHATHTVAWGTGKPEPICDDCLEGMRGCGALDFEDVKVEKLGSAPPAEGVESGS